MPGFCLGLAADPGNTFLISARCFERYEKRYVDRHATTLERCDLCRLSSDERAVWQRLGQQGDRVLAARHRLEGELPALRSLGALAAIEHDDGVVDGRFSAVGGAVAIQVADDAAADGAKRNQSERHLSRVVS